MSGMRVYTPGDVEAVNGTDVRLKCTFQSTASLNPNTMVIFWSFRPLKPGREESVSEASGGIRPFRPEGGLRTVVLCERTSVAGQPNLATAFTPAGLPLPTATIPASRWHFQEACHLGRGRDGPRRLHHHTAGQVHLQRHVCLPGQESAGRSRPEWRDSAPRGHYRSVPLTSKHSPSGG